MYFCTCICAGMNSYAHGATGQPPVSFYRRVNLIFVRQSLSLGCGACLLATPTPKILLSLPLLQLQAHAI